MIKHLPLLLFISFSFSSFSQDTDKAPVKSIPELRYNINEDGSHFIKFTFLNQIWLRYNESNPGTTVFGYERDATYDIGLRRTRIQLFGQLTDRIFFYTQFGQNNLSYISPRKQGLFFLDALGEFSIIKNKLSIGSGLTGWSGLSRYASPSVGSILSLDAPLYQQATNDVNDQFLRKLSIYTKGKIGKLDYRMALSSPLPIQTSPSQAPTIASYSLFSAEPAHPQWHGYFMYQFKDQESNLTPYNTGSYLGNKDVFNIGTGFLYQKDAMWMLENGGADTSRSAMKLFAVDVFWDHPLNKELKTAVTAYEALSYYDFGKDYLRQVGAMNPANGNIRPDVLNGAGSAFPMVGTGTTVYLQAAYLFRSDLLKSRGTLQIFSAMQYSDFERSNVDMILFEAGANWLIIGHQAKLSAVLQNRPVFLANPSGNYLVSERKNMLVLQMQISI